MNMYEEIDKETIELLLDSLTSRTLTGKQEWKELGYKPISFMQEDEDAENDAFISQLFEMETEFNGRRYVLEIMEQIVFPSGRGDISGTLTFDGGSWGKYDFALSFDERYDENGPERLREVFADSAIVKLMDAVITVFEGMEAENQGFSYARYYNQKGIEPKWRRMPLVKIGEKLMEEKRMKDFHRMILDMDYREKLLKECLG